MPIQYDIFSDLKVVYVRCVGDVALDQIVRFEVEVTDDDRFDSTFTELIDLRDASSLDLRYETMGKVVEYEKAHELYTGDRKVAFVAPKDSIFGVLRMYQSMEEDSPMETLLFRGMDDACAAIGVSPDRFEKPQ